MLFCKWSGAILQVECYSTSRMVLLEWRCSASGVVLLLFCKWSGAIEVLFCKCSDVYVCNTPLAEYYTPLAEYHHSTCRIALHLQENTTPPAGKHYFTCIIALLLQNSTPGYWIKSGHRVTRHYNFKVNL